MLTRTYGSTKEKLSVIGFAGIIVMNETPAEAARYVAEALDQGVNYFDVAPSYGNAQERLGPALAGRRGEVFLACKTGKRTRDDALEELHESLHLLQTDHFDLYQMHSMTTREDVEIAMGPGGVMEALLQARTDGKIRHIGFSAHSDEAALALLDLYPFESVLMPFNWMTYLREGFGQPTVEKASAMGVTLLALKALARGAWPESLPPEQRPYPKCWYQPIEDPDQADLALRFTLSLPVTAAITPGDMRIFRLAIRTVANFHPISEAEISQLMHMDLDMKPIFK